MEHSLQIPNKSLFKLSEVSDLTGVKPYVLRFWEAEFDLISPLVSSTGQKLYEPKDIEAIMLIKKLLFEDKLTIDKARGKIQLLGKGTSDEEAHVPRMPRVAMELTEKDLQKLIVAKAKLQSLVRGIESLQKAHRWN